MSRPNKVGLDYYPMDVDMDQDDKIVPIEALYGSTGYMVVTKLWAKIYKENGYYYKWGRKEQLIFSKKQNVDINLLDEIINECINAEVFDINVYNNYGVLTSVGIQKRFMEAVKRRKEVVIINEYYLGIDLKKYFKSSKIEIIWVDVNSNRINVDINSENGNISTQSKVENISIHNHNHRGQLNFSAPQTEKREDSPPTPSLPNNNLNPYFILKPIDVCKDTFFTDSFFSTSISQLVARVRNQNEDIEPCIDRLKEWACVLNKYMVGQGDLQRPMTGREGWVGYFTNWLSRQGSVVMQSPPENYNPKKSSNDSNPRSNSPSGQSGSGKKETIGGIAADKVKDFSNRQRNFGGSTGT